MKKKIVVIGLGDSGFSCVEHLSSHMGKAQIIVFDTREYPPRLSELQHRYPHIQVRTGNLASADIACAEYVVLSPGISKDHPDIKSALKEDAVIMGDIELFAQSAHAPVVAITGSNGKSTVTTLVGEMAKQAGVRVGVGGNLGTPALNLLKADADLYVLELSSFQLETTYSLKPTVATVLNISPDHLDRYGAVETYYQAKQRIFNGSKQAVINRDDEYILNRLPKNLQDIPKISFGLSSTFSPDFGILETNISKSSLWIAKGQQPLLPLSELKLLGRHNIANALAALALGDAIQLPMSIMLKTLQTFTGLTHRCEWVREYQGVRWVNDSKGTNVAATQSVLIGLAQEIPGKWVLIAGGRGKNTDFSELKSSVLQYCRSVILMGEVAAELNALLSTDIRCIIAGDMEEAVFLAAREAKPGDGVLLSPACSSFDMFRNFEHRGDVFKECVFRLK